MSWHLWFVVFQWALVALTYRFEFAPWTRGFIVGIAVSVTARAIGVVNGGAA